jgi:CheY-like chemotaxis protein
VTLSRKNLKSTDSVPLRRPGDASSARPPILLVDTDEGARTTLMLALRARGWNVVVANDVRGAIERAEDEQPIAIISELNLPDARGYFFARTLKTMVEHDVAIVGVTRVNPTEFGQALAAGFDAVFEKPIDVDTLLSALNLATK